MADSLNLPSLRELVLKTNQPIVLKDVLDWQLTHWDLNKWSEILGKDELSFRCGKHAHSELPQFENTTTTVHLTFSDFMKCAQMSVSDWLYFDYKYLKHWFTTAPELKSQINWKCMGFHEVGIDDSVIWIGSKGAHTPCHFDAYGCNIVAQIFGRKRWILFPPQENLQSTRIPYEESSIYSKLNFFSPNLLEMKKLSNCHHVILEPGNILIVPHGWWHYVESLDLTISINTWLPLESDNESRLEEAIVQSLFAQFYKELPTEQREIACNSNDDIAHNSLSYYVDLIQNCVEQCKHIRANENANADDDCELITFNDLKVPCLSNEDFQSFCYEQRRRFGDTEISSNSTLCKLIKFLDAILEVDVIKKIKENLLKS